MITREEAVATLIEEAMTGNTTTVAWSKAAVWCQDNLGDAATTILRRLSSTSDDAVELLELLGEAKPYDPSQAD